MKYVNKVILLGNVCSEPYYSDEGKSQRATFRLATNRYWRDAAGNDKEEAEFHDICVWGKQAEQVKDFVTKGKLLYIEGALRRREVGEGENMKQRTEIVVSTFIMCDKKDSLPSGGIE